MTYRFIWRPPCCARIDKIKYLLVLLVSISKFEMFDSYQICSPVHPAKPRFIQDHQLVWWNRVYTVKVTSSGGLYICGKSFDRYSNMTWVRYVTSSRWNFSARWLLKGRRLTYVSFTDATCICYFRARSQVTRSLWSAENFWTRLIHDSFQILQELPFDSSLTHIF